MNADGAALSTLTANGCKPLAEVARPVAIRLSCPEFGMFKGAKVVTLLDNDGPGAAGTEAAHPAWLGTRPVQSNGRLRLRISVTNVTILS